MPAIVISNSGMLSQMRGLELNFGDFELNFGDLNKKREIFRGDRGMPRKTLPKTENKIKNARGRSPRPAAGRAPAGTRGRGGADILA